MQLLTPVTVHRPKSKKNSFRGNYMRKYGIPNYIKCRGKKFQNENMENHSIEISTTKSFQYKNKKYSGKIQNLLYSIPVQDIKKKLISKVSLVCKMSIANCVMNEVWPVLLVLW